MGIRRMEKKPLLISLTVPSLKEKSIGSDGNFLAIAPPVMPQAAGSPGNQKPLFPAPEQVHGYIPRQSACWSWIILFQDACYWRFLLGWREPAETRVGQWLTGLAQRFAINIFNLVSNKRKKKKKRKMSAQLVFCLGRAAVWNDARGQPIVT